MSSSEDEKRWENAKQATLVCIACFSVVTTITILYILAVAKAMDYSMRLGLAIAIGPPLGLYCGCLCGIAEMKDDDSSRTPSRTV
jgi:hypothetical protein